MSTIPPGNHMPKPPIEVYPLFGVVGVPLAFAAWIGYEKLFNDTGVSFSPLHARHSPPRPSDPTPSSSSSSQSDVEPMPPTPRLHPVDWDHWSPDYWSL
ncbi:hypothetical protein CPB86DRAFT_785571 [Serendipita vermifera]|nr:hypothetical protein CPB86DRAFT_785571 [Serendipita vermifera]